MEGYIKLYRQIIGKQTLLNLVQNNYILQMVMITLTKNNKVLNKSFASNGAKDDVVSVINNIHNRFTSIGFRAGRGILFFTHPIERKLSRNCYTILDRIIDVMNKKAKRFAL